jgi:hypothetical protein
MTLAIAVMVGFFAIMLFIGIGVMWALLLSDISTRETDLAA